MRVIEECVRPIAVRLWRAAATPNGTVTWREVFDLCKPYKTIVEGEDHVFTSCVFQTLREADNLASPDGLVYSVLMEPTKIGFFASEKTKARPYYDALRQGMSEHELFKTCEQPGPARQIIEQARKEVRADCDARKVKRTTP